MKLSEFRIGEVFRTGSGEWVCTDIGTRTILAVEKEEYERNSGQLIYCDEVVFFDYDFEGCWKSVEGLGE